MTADDVIVAASNRIQRVLIIHRRLELKLARKINDPRRPSFVEIIHMAAIIRRLLSLRVGARHCCDFFLF